MKSICITGAVQADLNHVAAIMQQAGMQPPKPAKHDSTIDIGFWHRQVMALVTEESGDTQSVLNPGRLWEQLASDIFVANINSKIWGWSDAQSTWLLDYWLGFEPHLNFILVCVSPQQMLASAMISETDTMSVETVMNAWQVHHQELLRFHLRNPQRSLLVDLNECTNYPESLIERCAEQWRLPLAIPVDAAPTGIASDSLAIYLAQQLCQDYPEIASLQHELAATITHLSEGDQGAGLVAPGPTQIIADYRALRDRSTEIRQLQTVEEEFATLKIRFDETLINHVQQQKDSEEIFNEATKEIESLQLQLRQAQKELEAASLKYESWQDELDTLSEVNNALKADKEALIQERDRQAKHAAELQAQINTLTKSNQGLKSDQEALIQQKSALAGQLEPIKQEVATLSKARNEQKAHAEQQQAQIEKLTQERDSQASQAVQKQTQIEKLIQEINSLKADRETTAQQKSALVAQLEPLKQEVATLSKARDEQKAHAGQQQAQIEKLTQERDSHANQAVQKQAQIDTLSQEINALKAGREAVMQEKSALTAQLEALNQEVATLSKTRDEQAHLLAERQAQLEQLDKMQAENNELLLLELHQAHLESEQYFQQHQETLNQLQTAEARWQRLLQRNPAYLDYETIEILPASPGEDDTITWRLTNFSTAERQIPVLEFKTPLEQGIAGFVFKHSDESNSLFKRWPASANQQDELVLMPVGARANSQQCIENLFDLATSDWELLKALTSLLIEKLATPAILEKHADIQPEAFRTGLEKFNQILQKFPSTLRYDQIQLKREQINPGYEHLWFHFDNFSFGGKRWPEFEFRLACANVQPDQFGSHPKLEFPEAGSKVLLKNWFVDSHDDFGPKLELRFAQPDAMDMGIWWRLTDQDRSFLAILVKRLPFILRALQTTGTQLDRPWADWSKLVSEVQRIFAVRTAVSQIPKPVSSTQPAATETNTSPSNAQKPVLEPITSIKRADNSEGKSSLTKSTEKAGATRSAQASKKRKAQK